MIKIVSVVLQGRFYYKKKKTNLEVGMVFYYLKRQKRSQSWCFETSSSRVFKYYTNDSWVCKLLSKVSYCPLIYCNDVNVSLSLLVSQVVLCLEVVMLNIRIHILTSNLELLF